MKSMVRRPCDVPLFNLLFKNIFKTNLVDGNIFQIVQLFTIKLWLQAPMRCKYHCIKKSATII